MVYVWTHRDAKNEQKTSKIFVQKNKKQKYVLLNGDNDFLKSFKRK